MTDIGRHGMEKVLVVEGVLRTSVAPPTRRNAVRHLQLNLVEAVRQLLQLALDVEDIREAAP